MSLYESPVFSNVPSTAQGHRKKKKKTPKSPLIQNVALRETCILLTSRQQQKEEEDRKSPKTKYCFENKMVLIRKRFIYVKRSL